MRVLVTGAAGFIGSTLARHLLARGDEVVGFDSLNDYYDPKLKAARLATLEPLPGFAFVRGALESEGALEEAFETSRPDAVVNLAAQVGVRYSIENPKAYIHANVVGFMNVLEACRRHKVANLVYASSSSVYGNSDQMPLSVDQPVDHPISMYAATKKSNELMAHVYSHLFGLPTTGLRFFTVYGPWGRPDMAPHLFTSAILEGRPIKVFNHGKMRRDFTYVDDIVQGVMRVVDRPAPPDDRGVRYAVYNIGNSEPVELMEFIQTLEQCLGCEAQKQFLEAQPGDVVATFADVESLARDTGFRPSTPLREGLTRWVAWFREYYGL